MASRAHGSSGQSSGSSRRDVQSVSSTTSGRSDRGSRQPKVHDSIESAVTRLLVAIKELLESLTQWSESNLSEEGVSDVYVRLGNDFNAAVHAFGLFNIEMSELLSIPDDLRTVLEQCLAEEATPENLDLYLPNVRQIITSLLQGLRVKQGIYRKIHRESGHERTDSKSRTNESRREGSQRSTGPRSHTRDGSDGTTGSRRNKKRETPISHSGTNGSGEFVGGFIPTLAEHPMGQDDDSGAYSDSQRRHERSTPASSLNQVSTYGTPSTEPHELPTYSRGATPAELPPPPPASPPPVPSNVKRYSLVDKPMDKPIDAAPSVVIQPSSPLNGQDHVDSPQSETASEPPASVAKSLAALKSNDVLLERRASKRFSTYNISKMTGGSMSRERSIRNTTTHPNRRSLAANTNILTPGELAVLTEVDDEEGSQVDDGVQHFSRSPDRNGVPPMPPFPTPSKTPEPSTVQDGKQRPNIFSSKITIFLQVGREVKKVTVEPGISFAALRVLFVDKFSYNPGLENFPAIYIRDPSSQVQYELEDSDEVKDNCLLSLNIEPLDQIKQHIDSQIASLANDLKDLKSAMLAKNQQDLIPLADFSSSSDLVESTPAMHRPSEKQFQTVARRLSRFMGDGTISPFAIPTPQPLPSGAMASIQAHITGQSLQPQMTGASVMSEYTTRVVTDLKTQFDEVQNLRRDLGIMRQLYTEFMKSTKETLNNLRTQTHSVKQLANSNIGGARQYIDTGKKKLDTRSQNVLTEIEKLQDIIESVKDDVIKRQITPNAMFFKSVKKEIDSVATELASLSEHIKAVKPMWKKTWEEELQNIVEEQQFLTHQEEFLGDLLEDHKAMVEVYGHVEKVISLRRPAGPKRGKGFKPRPQDENPDGLTAVMLEIRGAQVDSHKRLQAIEANQKNRQKMAGSTHELHDELYDFVGQKRLKMTGGAEEAERVRQKKSEATLKAMFNGTSSSGVIET